jgi:hypothetical protein
LLLEAGSRKYLLDNLLPSLMVIGRNEVVDWCFRGAALEFLRADSRQVH